ncbi:gliding motility lipoprotein GldD [Flavobacterium sp. LS1P28]|uniref:Gliding motility lipoprotein GldD n=1 Tax=Flavobacterium bomense TaxID=2497483 RepID=A0A3S0MKQ5_9FLAO|nr:MULTISPECIES: gliding motility lipoprotein GldD [Flavobacterium]RTY70564.1 gliding motility lipoprotein GldD [Flavobacterium sp. LB2P53]RTY76122.1 gliding motility lipoprotein GldD [Flavobacterium sp. LS1R10]RTY82667.1 gliding motility lipoprotein GldD [Flavobacterium sp. ZB4P23]RTY85041.1 gliding motility lipoprotein GldD [Flavobacterium sp. LS1P28]RTY98885.1 gliding motility lipoprotein GldD [Flavobacterium sp. RSP49]
MFKKTIPFLVIALTSLLSFSCKDAVIPKPSAYLRLDYPQASYMNFENECPFAFEMNSEAVIQKEPNCGFTITYPKMKATIYLTYKPVTKNINELLRDAQKLTYEHVIKADDILEQPYLNPDKKVYGMFYQVEGNAATNSQFYATDSTSHFLTGSVYFYAKPNYDSIMPAASYIKNDMQRLMETLKWK